MCAIPNDASAKTNRIDVDTRIGYMLYNLLEFYPPDSIRKVLSKTLLMAMQSERFDEVPSTERTEIAFVFQSIQEVFDMADDATFRNV